MKTEESLYIKILIWSYNKSSTGFTHEELEKEFKLKEGDGEAYKMYLKLFRNGTINNPSLIDEYKYVNEKHYYCLSEKGMSAAIGYLDLKEAQKSGKRAEKISIVAIIIGVIVGIVQIITQIFYK
jgi:hypothetical protein